MMIYLHLIARRVNTRHLVVVGWEVVEVLLVSLVIKVPGALGCRIGVVFNSLDLPLVTHRMCRVVVWSRPCPLKFQSLVGGSVSEFLGVRVMYQGRSMRCMCSQRCLLHRCGNVFICVVVQIQLVLPSSVDTPSECIV